MKKTNNFLLKTIQACVSLTIIGSTFVATNAVAKEEVKISLITAPFGTGSYVLGSALEEISKKQHPWLRITSSESPGFIFNIKKLDKEPELRLTMIVGSGAGVAGLAAAGDLPFDKKYVPPLKLIANYNLGAYWLATLNPNIKSVSDLAGKKVALGRAAQINWAVQPAAIMNIGYGLTKSNVNVQYVGVKEAIAALLDGNVDAAVVGGYFDPLTQKMVLSPQTAEFIASGRKITHLQWGKIAVDKTKATGMKMANITVPANTIPGVSQPLEVAADTISWMVSQEFPEPIAYETTKLIINNIKLFDEFHALGKLMSSDGLIYGWDITDIHPGALRAYREAGIIK
jgi:TRAP transporter TAXI family solute receptor